MAQIGTIELATANGWKEIAVYDIGTFDYEPLEVPCDNFWGSVALVDPAEADTPLEVYTQARGWQGINTTASAEPVTIDDFEHNNLAAYYGIADTSNPPEIRQEAARSGTYGFYGYSDARAMSLPSSHPNHSSTVQPNQLGQYPKSGDVFEFYIYVKGYISGGTAINRFHWGKQDYEESANGYRIWLSLNDDYWRIEKRVNGVGTTLGDARLGSNWPTNEWLRGVVDWRGSGFTATMYRQNGTVVDSLSTNDTAYTSGGIGYDNGQYAITYTDDWRMVNP